MPKPLIFPLDTLPYGTRKLLRPGQVQSDLDIGSEALRTIKPEMHRIVILAASGLTLFPTEYVDGVAGSLARAREEGGKISTPKITRAYGRTESARTAIGHAEADFETALHARTHEGLVSLEAIVALFGLSRETVSGWVESDLLDPRELRAGGSVQLFIPEPDFRGLYAWHRPNVVGAIDGQ